MTPEQNAALDRFLAAITLLIDELLHAIPQDDLSLPIHVFSEYQRSIKERRECEPARALAAARSIIGDTEFIMRGAFFDKTDRPEVLWQRFRDAQALARALPQPPMQIETWRDDTPRGE